MRKSLYKTALVLTSIGVLINCNVEAINEEKTPETCYITNVSEEVTPTVVDIGLCKITAYCKENYPHICNDGNSSVTATGTKPTPGRTIAVDPSIIPYGSEVIINGHSYSYIAEDCGGAVKGNRIDILFATHQEALEFGIQYANVSYIDRSDNMCAECRQHPCHPRCPNANEPPVVCLCDNCDSEIREGDTMYVIGDNRFCEECVSKGSTYAEVDEF